MSTSQEKNDPKKSKQWTYRDPYRYPIPRADGDPLEIVLEPLLAKDKAQCDAWKDEVQNLLIFAGLFSAVITSFVVESSKDLQLDPNTLLLSQIVTLLGNNTSGTPGIPPQIQLSPSPSSYRINALWFASLVLSLTTVLVGIISLQWLREHQRYSALSLHDKFSIFSMRQESLEAWYVPQIFAGLPLLLQGALALYLVGLIDHLLGFGPSVAIPGIIFILLTLLFFIATTILPTLQCLIVLPTQLEITLDLPSPCPYKSPQSHAFRRLAAAFQKGFLATRWLITRAQWLTMHFQQFLYQYIQLEATQPRFVKTSDRIQCFPASLCYSASWLEFDRSWLSLHDCMCLNIMDPPYFEESSYISVTFYDAIKGIRSIAQGSDIDQSERYLFAQFHFLNNIPSLIVGEDHGMMLPQIYLNTYFRLLHYDDRPWAKPWGHSPPPESLFKILANSNFGSRFLSELNTLAIMETIDPFRGCSPILSRHSAECELRLLAAVCSEIYPLFPESTASKTFSKTYSQSLCWSIQDVHKTENATTVEFLHQLGLCINSFFQAIINSRLDNPHLEKSFHAYTFFFHYLASPLWLENLEIATVVVSTITALSTALKEKPNPARDFLFYPASYFARKVTTDYKHPNIIAAIPTLLEALRDYKDRLGEGNHSLQERFGIPGFSDQGWWKFLELPEVKPSSVCRPNSEEIVIVVMGAKIKDDR